MMRHGSHLDPANRFERVRVRIDESPATNEPERQIEFYDDQSQSIVSENKSPDIPFRYSVNPYRGCVHGCSYCYARPTHEYLGFNAGLEFETRIVVKRNAPDLFRRFLAKKSWQPEPVVFSGVTDCYQPAERQFELTRGCVQVAAECNLPIGIVTKNALVVRDLDLLARLADRKLVHVFLSVTTLDISLARAMEPRTSIPAARIRAIESLAAAGIPVGVMIAPIIPGLNDSEVPEILRAASIAGATTAGYVMLRLPLTVEPVFVEWLERTQPTKAQRVLNRIELVRNGSRNDSTFGRRMVGTGPMANQIQQMFQLFKKKFGLSDPMPPRDISKFRPPPATNGQAWLF